VPHFVIISTLCTTWPAATFDLLYLFNHDTKIFPIFLTFIVDNNFPKIIDVIMLNKTALWL